MIVSTLNVERVGCNIQFRGFAYDHFDFELHDVKTRTSNQNTASVDYRSAQAIIMASFRLFAAMLQGHGRGPALE